MSTAGETGHAAPAADRAAGAVAPGARGFAADDGHATPEAHVAVGGEVNDAGPVGDAGGLPAPAERVARGSAGGRRGRGVRRKARPPRRGRVAGALLVLALLGSGGGLLAAARSQTGSAAADNRALTDAEATARVVGDVSSAVATVFTYAPDTLDSTRQRARQLLRGAAAKEYGALFEQVERRAGEQELTLTTHVVRAGVTRLDGGSAELLLFLDQTSERAGEEPATAAAQLSVGAELRGGTWRITRIKAR